MKAHMIFSWEQQILDCRSLAYLWLSGFSVLIGMQLKAMYFKRKLKRRANLRRLANSRVLAVLFFFWTKQCEQVFLQVWIQQENEQ